MRILLSIWLAVTHEISICLESHFMDIRILPASVVAPARNLLSAASMIKPFISLITIYWPSRNKAPRSKQRGINTALQAAGFQPAFAPRGGELSPERLKKSEV